MISDARINRKEGNVMCESGKYRVRKRNEKRLCFWRVLGFGNLEFQGQDGEEAQTRGKPNVFFISGNTFSI